jgi:hypothetical protein
MSASETPSGTAAAKLPATLSARAFPRRARRLLESILEYASDELERTLAATLDDVEQQLFKLAEQARSNEVQQHCFEALRTVKRGRSDLTPRFMIGLEAALASIRDPEVAKGRSADDTGFGNLALVDMMDADESAALREIASRMEIRNSLPLYLLGQRFGVLAGHPAFDPEHLPVGPHVLCHILADATRCLDLSSANRLVVFRQFDRQITPAFGGLIEAINTLLIREGVLPHLSFVPVRGRAADARRGAGKARADQSGEAAPEGRGAPAPTPTPEPAAALPPRLGAVADAAPTPLTAWPSIEPPVPLDTAGGENTFSVLRDLLASRRALLGKLGQGPAAGAAKPKEHQHVVSEDDVQSVLGVLQHKPNHAVLVNGQPAPRSVTHVKQDLLNQLRQIAPEGKAPALAEEDTDTIDLVGMLFDVLMRDVKPNSPAATLLAKLQVPLLRVALRDKDFFTQQRHPARQMLNAVAESGTFWLGEDDGDSGTVEKMQLLVDRVVGEFNGDLNIFDTLLQDLGGHLQTLARKAEVSERRHVDAARGKEKLALARLRASEEVAERLKGRKVPRFVKTLLTEAWADVLALSLLRQGEDSAAYKQQLAVAEQLIDAARADKGASKTRSASEIEALRHEIEHSLCQVGYHAEDAQAIANRLSEASEPESTDDPASRTELALRLKARSRLGADVEPKHAAKPVESLSAEETAAIAQIKQLPFGTWFEFSDTPSGERVRRRMSWFSTLTGHVLFVNHRGQRVGEHTLQTLAHAMANGTAELVVTQRSTLIDRAWNSIVSALKSFAGKPALAGDAA